MTEGDSEEDVTIQSNEQNLIADLFVSETLRAFWDSKKLRRFHEASRI